MNLRVSVTDIDAWVYWRNHEDSDLDKLMRQLRKEEPQNEPMRVGSAFHKAMELAQPGVALSLEANGYTFTMAPFASPVELALPEFRELKLETEIDLGSNLTITLVGKVDAMEYRTVHDHKTTARFDAERMLESCQWQMYLNVADADVFQWNIFEIKQIGLTEYEVFNFHKLRQYRYPDLADDCMRTLRGFLAFLNVENMRPPSEQCTLANLLKAN